MLTRDEQRVVRRIGGWKIAHLIASPDTWSTEYFGGSHFNALGRERDWLDCTGTEIRVGALASENGWAFRLKWNRVKTYARHLPADLIEQVATNNRAVQQNMSDCPRFTASGPACGHGRPLWWFGKQGPLTEGQALYVDEYEAWEASGAHDRWQAEKDALLAERERLLDRAFPLAVDDEPADLLELLEAL